MEQSQWEILILKPTKVFLSFLASQLSEERQLPDLKTLQADSTAYTIRRHDDDEAMLDEIEKNFTLMFRHEIARWLGADARNNIEASFLDFLCCFKFELHSQIVLMEPRLEDGHQLFCVKPRTVLLKWMQSVSEDDHEISDDLAMVLNKVALSDLAENSTVVVKNFDHLSDVQPFINHYYQPIYKAEMLRMNDQAEQWPEMNSFKQFSRYFRVEMHTQLVHLH